jgi:DHA1 family tetracycline resistance protein-like MFS transporter
VIAYRPVFVLTVFLFLAMVILSTGYALLPTFLFEYRDLSVGAIGWLGSLTGVGGMLLALGFTRSRRRTRVASPILITLGIVPLSLLLLIGSGSLWAIAVASLLAGSWGLVWALADAAVGNIAPERLRALSFGFSEVLGGSGVAIGPMLAGLLFDVGPRAPLLVALGGTLLVLLPGALYLRGYLEHAQATLEREEQEQEVHIAVST